MKTGVCRSWRRKRRKIKMAVFYDVVYVELVDRIINVFINIPAYVVGPVTTFALMGVTLSIMYQGLDTIRGAGGANPILDVIAKSTRPMLVLMFAASLSAFQGTVRPFLEKDLLFFLINAGTAAGAPIVPGADVYETIFKALDTACNAQFDAINGMVTEAITHLDPIGFTLDPLYIGWPFKKNFYIIPALRPDASGFVALPFAGLLYILVIVTAVIVLFQAIFTTVALNFVLAFGPLFLAMYAFEKTEKYASHWLDSVLKYIFSFAVLLILFSIGAGLMTTEIESAVAAYVAAPTDIGALAENCYPSFIIGAAMAYIMSRADELAQDLIGGQASTGGGFQAAVAAGAAGAYKAVKGDKKNDQGDKDKDKGDKNKSKEKQQSSKDGKSGESQGSGGGSQASPSSSVLAASSSVQNSEQGSEGGESGGSEGSGSGSQSSPSSSVLDASSAVQNADLSQAASSAG